MRFYFPEVHLYGSTHKVRNISALKLLRGKMRLKIINETFSLCKVEDYSGIDLQADFVFTSSTDEERSLEANGYEIAKCITT